MASLEKAMITNFATGDEIEVLFNPEEVTFNKDNNLAQVPIPGLSSPLLQFVHGNLQTLEMELLVDSYESHKSGNRVLNRAGEDVRKLTRQVRGLLDIDPETHAPPLLLFTWGSVTFKCVLARCSERLIMFLPSGIPVRARLQVTFHEYVDAEEEARNIKRETSDFTHLHVVTEGETASDIAGQVYRDPTMWRPIAIHNQLADPRRLTVGRRLMIPRLPFVDPESGEVMS
jgi:hypothetical protein